MWHAAVNQVRLLRVRIASRLTMGLRVIVLGVVAGALVLLAEDDVAVGLVVLLTGGAITWLAGLWVMPWGRDSYSRNISFIMRNLFSDLGNTDYREETEVVLYSLQRCIRRIERLKPPDVWAVCHREHLHSLTAYAVAIGDYQDATQGDSADAAEAMALRVSAAGAAFKTRTEEYSADLRRAWIKPSSVKHSQHQ
jgi:hypothetical protein